MSLQPLEHDNAFFCLTGSFSNDQIQLILTVTLSLDFYGVISFEKVSLERLLRQKPWIKFVK